MTTYPLRIFVLIMLMLTGSDSAFAQIRKSCSYRHFTTAHGMPGTQVQGLYEDSRGYIWAITDRGATRYDGYEFTTYTTRQGLPNNNVLLINEDNHGRMWFMCSTGDYCYLENDTILAYHGNERIRKLLKDRLPGPFYFDAADTLWVTTFSGIQLFKCFGDSVLEYQPQVSPSEQPTYYLRRVGEKLVTLQVGEVTKNNSIQTTDNISYLLSVAGECKLACSVQVEENKWAVAGPGGFVLFDEEGHVQAHFNASPYVFSTLEHDRDGNLWLTNSNGAYRLRDYTKGPDDAEVFFEGHFITSVLQDRSGNYWFGDRDNGLFMVPSLDIDIFRTGAASKQNKTVSIKRTGSDICYSDASGNIYVLHEDIALPVTENGVPSGVSLDFVNTTRGNFVLGNKPMLLDVHSGNLRSFGIGSTIRKSTTLHDGQCAFALSDGLAFLDQRENWIPVDKKIYKERSNTVYEDSNRQLWIGANSGLYKWTGDSVIAHEVNSQEKKARVSDIAEWNGLLVLATRNRGLLFITRGDVVELNESNGLLSDNVDCLAIDENQDIWIGTSAGLQRLKIINLQEKKINTFRISAEKGLPSNEINDLLFLGPKLYVATNDGLAILYPGSPSLNASEARISLNEFLAGNQPMDQNGGIELSYDQNNIRIRFYSLNYRTGNHTLYRYRLSGLHDQWQETNNRSAEYWSLAPGHYTFEVSAMNEDGLWGSNAIYTFEIRKHFTHTWWFITGLICTAILLIAGSFALVYASRQRKLENKAKMAELRQQALNANMNPHFIFNSLNSIQHFINTNHAEEANEYLSDFSRLIRMNLETNRHSLVSLNDELERLELYLRLEKLRFGEKLSYAISTDPLLNPMDLSIPPMLLQPYVENALLHGILPSGHGGELSVNISPMDEKKYRIHIRDNGIGIQEGLTRRKSTHESLALRMNEERLSILSSQTGEGFSVRIEDLSELEKNGRGTLVTLLLPINPE